MNNTITNSSLYVLICSIDSWLVALQQNKVVSDVVCKLDEMGDTLTGLPGLPSAPGGCRKGQQPLL